MVLALLHGGTTVTPRHRRGGGSKFSSDDMDVVVFWHSFLLAQFSSVCWSVWLMVVVSDPSLVVLRVRFEGEEVWFHGSVPFYSLRFTFLHSIFLLREDTDLIRGASPHHCCCFIGMRLFFLLELPSFAFREPPWSFVVVAFAAARLLCFGEVVTWSLFWWC